MNRNYFQHQMTRLVETFGGQHYKAERINLIWDEVADLDEGWLKQTVNRFIGEYRHAPLLPEFREEISKERERLWRAEKITHAKEAEEFFDGSYQPEDIRTICQTIIKRLGGGVSDANYETFQKMLHNVAVSAPKVQAIRQCRFCDGSGLVFYRDKDNYEWVGRCTCPQGERHSKAYPVARLQFGT